MQDLGNHMDELFQKAGDHYQLKPVDSSWDAIASKMPASAVTSVAMPRKKRKAVKVALLMLLPLFLVSIGIKRTGNGDVIFTGVASNSKASATTASHDIVASSNDNITTAPVKFSKAKTKTKNQSTSTVLPVIAYNKTFDQKYFNHSITNNKGTISKEHATDEELASTANNNKQTVSADSVTTISSNATKPKITIHAQSKFYLGVIAGVGYNEVKNQGFTKAGFNGGIIGGYQLNKKLAIETGLIITNKNYQSNGAYFSMKKMGTSMPADTKIMSVESKSTLLEIPLKLKYNFIEAKRLKFFTAAGLTSYVMLNEQNKYVTMVSGVQQNMRGTYKKASGYYAASVDVSAGASFRTGTNTQIQLAPYLQLPLKGLGMGSMMIATTGIQVGLIRAIK